MGDDELVARAQAGDASAFGRLVEIHQRRLCATLSRITGDPDLALDLAQDAFLRAWEALDRFERRSAFSTWLYRIAVRLAYDARRREPIREEIGDDLPDPDPVPDAIVEHELLVADLRRRIDDLPAMQRAVVVLRTYEEMPYREIAEILETTEGSARVSFHHAILRLRDGYPGPGGREAGKENA